MIKRSRSTDGHATRITSALPVSYNTAFRLVGPNPRVVVKRKQPPRGPVKFADELVLLARRLHEDGESNVSIGVILRYQDPRVTDNWVKQVLDGRIRNNVKEKPACK